jgi:Family of unknown function (DUF6167)
MSRVVWFAAGAGAGAYALVRARRAAEVLTPEGLGDRLSALSLGLRMFRSEVQAGMAEKENDLRERLLVALPGPTRPELSGGDVATATSPPDNSATHDTAPDATREGND